MHNYEKTVNKALDQHAKRNKNAPSTENPLTSSQKPPKAPRATNRLAAQRIDGCQGLAAFRNKSSSIF